MNISVLVVGSGMYVSGRGTAGYGTILPAISTFQKNTNSISKLFVVGTNVQRTKEAEIKSQQLSELTDVQLPIQFVPKEKDSIETYLNILQKIELPGCAIVAVPDHLHFEVTNECLKKGLHTLVVKPLTPLAHQAKGLIDLSKKNNLYGVVEFHKRWDRQNLILREEFQNGNLGLPLYTWTEYSQRKSIPIQNFQAWVEKSSILQYLGVHYLDIIRFATEAVPIRVMATGQKVWLKKQGMNVFDAIQCTVEWTSLSGNIFNQTLLLNWVDPETSSAMSDQKIKFVGTLGRYEGDQKERGIRLLYDSQKMEEPNPDFCRLYKKNDKTLDWEGYGINSITTFLDDVCKISENKIQPAQFEGKRPTFSEAFYSTAVIEAAHKSLQNNLSWQKVASL